MMIDHYVIGYQVYLPNINIYSISSLYLTDTY